uniref:TSC22 domain family protein 1 n=1 Tax=Panagrellus redivivus TaxID=6233 RepID=A0A7E4UTQ2_PANRE
MPSTDFGGGGSSTSTTSSSAPVSKKNSGIVGSQFGVDSLVLLSKESFLLHSVGNASSSQIVAIDSKIEQAMDLVKTHLMFAVREEVDLLRGKIVELETAVYKLEAENSILREHVPNEVLQNLNGTPTNAGNPTQGSSIVAAQ